MPPDKQKGAPPAGNGSAPRKSIAAGSNDGADTNLEIPIHQLHHRPVHPDELAALRAFWWRQAGAGNRMPAEIDVIVVEGDAG